MEENGFRVVTSELAKYVASNMCTVRKSKSEKNQEADKYGKVLKEKALKGITRDVR